MCNLKFFVVEVNKNSNQLVHSVRIEYWEMVQFTLDAATFFKLQPFEYHRRFFEQDTRPDGRAFDEQRQAHVKKSVLTKSIGSSQVKMGNTMVTCGVKAEIAEPTFDRPKEGFLVINVEVPSLCSPHYNPGMPHELTQYLTFHISQIVTKSNLLSLESLCIAPRRAAWTLFVDMLVINDDGNLLDACMLSLMAALKDVRLPTVKYNETDNTVKEVSDAPVQQLQLENSIVSHSFVYCDDKYVLLDPTFAEESVSATRLTVHMDSNGELAGILKEGGASSMSRELVQKCISIAKRQNKALLKLL